MTHTKGPWGIVSGVLVDSTKNTHRPVEVAGLCIAHFSGGSTAQQHQVDNAHLIAAAPELLEALEYMASACVLSPDADWPQGEDPLSVARAAIAKARGET